MQYQADSVKEYIAQIPEERKAIFAEIMAVINRNLPKGFIETTSYGMVCWAVPLETYPAGYHCAPNTPLPFLSLASQKNFIALYNMGLYAQKDLYDWFVAQYPKHCKTKLDMGKSCIRFKKMGDIPLELIGELCQKMTPKQWIDLYEKLYKK